MKVLSKRVISIFLILMFSVSILAGCSSDSKDPSASQGDKDEKPIVMKLASVAPVGDPRDQSAKKFAELVGQKTSGKVKMEVFPGGTLGDWRDTIEGLEPGIVQVVLESVGTLEAYTPLAAIDAVPFLYRDADHFQKVWYSETGQKILDKIAESGGFKIVGPQFRGARYVTSKKKIETVDDLKGLKIRVPPISIYLKTWEYLGAAPTPMAFTELYTGLQQGAVDAQENPLSINYSSAFYEVCPYLISTKHVLSNDVFIFNKKYFDGLSQGIQAAIMEAAVETGQWRTQFELSQEEDYIKKFQEKNAEVIEPEISGFKEKVKDITNDFPELKEFVTMIEAVK